MPNVDKTEVRGTVKGSFQGLDLFQFDIVVDHTNTKQASGSADISINTTWNDFEISNAKFLFVQTDGTAAVSLQNASGYYNPAQVFSVDGVFLLEFPTGSVAPFSILTITNTSSKSSIAVSWWAGG